MCVRARVISLVKRSHILREITRPGALRGRQKRPSWRPQAGGWQIRGFLVRCRTTTYKTIENSSLIGRFLEARSASKIAIITHKITFSTTYKPPNKRCKFPELYVPCYYSLIGRRSVCICPVCGSGNYGGMGPIWHAGMGPAGSFRGFWHHLGWFVDGGMGPAVGFGKFGGMGPARFVGWPEGRPAVKGLAGSQPRETSWQPGTLVASEEALCLW